MERVKEMNHQGPISSNARALTFALLLVASLTGAIATSTTAHADPLAKPNNVVAHEHLKTGNRYYRVREFEKAIEEYKAGALREDASVFYYNLGQCYRQLGRYEDAIWHYERFLERGRPTGDVATSVKDFVVQMKNELEKKAMKQPPVEPAPTSPASPLPEGGPGPAQALPGGNPGMSLQRKFALTIGAAGIAAVGVGVGIGLRARSFKDDAAAICPMSPCARPDEANALIERGKTNARYANIGFGVGATAVLGAAVLWLTGSPAERKSTTITPQVSPAFAGIAAALKF